MFVPLARDATAEAVRRVVAELRARVPLFEERAEMYALGYHLREEIEAMLQDEGMDELFKVSPTLQRTFEQGKKKGREEGLQKGLQKGIELMLRRLFVRRLGRPLTEMEQRALSGKARKQDPGAVEDRALSLEGEALAAWLLDPNAT